MDTLIWHVIKTTSLGFSLQSDKNRCWDNSMTCVAASATLTLVSLFLTCVQPLSHQACHKEEEFTDLCHSQCTCDTPDGYIDLSPLASQPEWVGIWHSGKLPFDCQKIAKNLTVFSKNWQKLSFKKKNCRWQFFWKMTIFCNFLNICHGFGIFFLHSNGNFPGSQMAHC